MNHHLPLRRKIIIMVSVMASLFLVALDQTIIATALGKIVEEFNAFDSLSWIVTAYLLTTTVTVPIAGKLSDLFGRRILLLIGVTIFALGSLTSGMAPSVELLVWARALQGIGGGIITANAFTVIGDLFAARERGRWQGMIGAVFGLSSVVGPLLGGWLTDHQHILGLTTDWRWTFYINVPVALLAFLFIARYCPPLKRDKKPRIDYVGAGLLSVALATLVLAVDNTEEVFAGFLATTNITLASLRFIMAAVIVAAVAGFVWVERRSVEPILPFRFFKNRNFTLIVGIAALFGAAFMGSILYLTQFNQQVFGASPTQSGLMLLPMIAGLMITSIGSGQLIARTGNYKIFMQGGIVLATVMVFMLSTLTPASAYWYEAFIMVLLGAGLGVVMPVMNLAVQNEFEQKDLGVATSANQLFRSLGSTIGIALFGAMLTAGLTSGLGTTNATHDPYLRQLSASANVRAIGDINDVNTQLNLNMPDVKEAITAGFTKQVASVPPAERQALTQRFLAAQRTYGDTVEEAFASSLASIFHVSTVLMAAAAVLVFSIKEKKLQKADAESTPGMA